MAEGRSDLGTVIGCFLERAAERGSQPLWYRRSGGRWHPVSWESALSEVRRLAAGLASIGITQGDRVGLIGPNVPEWVMADYAIQHVAGVVVPIYDTSSSDQIADILTRTGARVCLAYGDEAIGKIREAMLPDLDTVVALHWDEEEHDQFLGYGALCQRGETWIEEHPEGLARRLADLDPAQIATIIFTSGTGDDPKGVALSHHNLVWAADASVQAVGIGRREITLSYLPLAHASERVITTVVPLVPNTKRWTCWFVEDLEGLPAAIRSVRPTIFLAVPVVWARMHDRIQAELLARGFARRGLARIALAAGESAIRHRDDGRSVAPHVRLGASSAKFLGRRVLKKLGLDRCWFAISGAAPLAESTQRFFQALGLPLHQGWGLTETAALCTVQRPDDLEVGVVGKPLEGVELRLGADGEVQVRGPNVFAGYETEPPSNKQMFDEEGYLRTGDVGRLTEDGRLVIIDRLKDLIITSGGRNVAPRPMEEKLEEEPLINETMVLGEGRPYLTALISIDGGEAARAVGSRLQEDEGLWEHPTVHQRVDRAVAALNRSLPDAEQVHRYAIVPVGFPDAALTPTWKLKRRVVEETFADLIESLYV